MNETTARQQIIEVARSIFDRGLSLSLIHI